jgi:hypothetical protein
MIFANQVTPETTRQEGANFAMRKTKEPCAAAPNL